MKVNGVSRYLRCMILMKLMYVIFVGIYFFKNALRFGFVKIFERKILCVGFMLVYVFFVVVVVLLFIEFYNLIVLLMFFCLSFF